MVAADPYRTLGVPHSASKAEIKRAYYNLARKYHPDKSEGACGAFALCAEAYAILSDAKRKAEYDHIYKYGGFDEVEDDSPPPKRSVPPSRKRNASGSSSTSELGVGYACYDPFAFLYTRGEILTRHTICGVQIPSRVHATGNLRFAFSSGNVVSAPGGTTKCTSQTTQFVHGRKTTRTETVTYFPDGRKEVVIEGDDGSTRRFSTYTNVSSKPSPWYMQAWKEIQNKLTVCYSPCTAETPQ